MLSRVPTSVAFKVASIQSILSTVGMLFEAIVRPADLSRHGPARS
jgi:hypothetical protein